MVIPLVFFLQLRLRLNGSVYLTTKEWRRRLIQNDEDHFQAEAGVGQLQEERPRALIGKGL